MKNYTITVNGNVYDVVVEEGAARAATARVQAPAAPIAAAPVATAPVAAPEPVAAPVVSGAAGTIKIEAGAAGKIFKIEATVGQVVKKGDTVLVLEAMKMEIPVVTPSDGVIASINVSTGDRVEAGGVLATLN